MTRKQPIELFMPPNMLKAKMGGGLGGIDMAALKRAEAALEQVSGEFAEWLDQDVRALAEASAHHARHPDAESRAALLRAAHDIKGQAATFAFPLVGRVAASLSRLLDEAPPAHALPPGLIEAHVQAVQAIHRKNIKDARDATASTLCAELEARVRETLKAA